ncbi:MAG: aminotransferase class V-fold PLP-dependent enzyme [Oscillospiraceae bacterium]|nr:aminotransferase class V-fold PLP-dependent enzyme [Oscillospiraceae bacterium]
MIEFLTHFLDNYTKNQTFRAHMPGHKGKSLLPELNPAYARDITEIKGADSLFEADGILRQAERQTAEIYHVPESCWSAGGSTLCIQAMLAQMKAERRTVISARTVHRAFLNSCILLDLPVKWVFPENGNLISGNYRVQDFEKALQEVSAPACIYLTSPDYAGNLQPIAEIAELCRNYHAKLLVDNAHGAHLAFLEKNLHPIALGADYCCDSAHKTLPALTGGAFLHLKDASQVMQIKQHMQMFGSTSPSYLIMQSLESCTAWLADSGKEKIQLCVRRAERLKQKLSSAYRFIGSDPLHLTISANGELLAEQLRNCPYPVECEYADKTCLVLLLSPVMTEQDFDYLASALESVQPVLPECPPPLPEPMKQICSLRDAGLAPFEIIPLEQAENRICASVQVPCPPAVPIAVSGERFSRQWLDFMAFYGLKQAAVVRNS